MSETSSPHLSVREFWRRLPTPARWFLATTAFQTLGRGLTMPFTVIYMHEVRHIELGTAGTLMSLIAVMALVVAGPGGHLTDRVGPRLMLLTTCAAQVAACVVLAFSTQVWHFAVGLALMGYSFGVSWPAFNALVAAVVSGPMRQQLYGVNFALINLGIGLGGIVGGLFVDVHRPLTFTTVFLADAACMLFPIALLLGPLRRVTGRVEAPDDSDEPGSYRTIALRPEVRWLLAVTFLLTFVGYGQMETGVPAFARQVSEVSTRVVGFGLAANTAAIVLLQFATLRLIAGRARTHVLHVTVVVFALSWLVFGATGLMPGGPAAVGGVLAFMALFGYGETFMQSALPSLTNDMAPDHLRGRYNALSSLAFQGGAIAAPVAAGFLLQHGWWVVYVAAVLAGLVLAATCTAVLQRHASPAVNGLVEA